MGKHSSFGVWGGEAVAGQAESHSLGMNDVVSVVLLAELQMCVGEVYLKFVRADWRRLLRARAASSGAFSGVGSITDAAGAPGAGVL